MFLPQYLNDLEGFRKMQNNAKCLYHSARGEEKRAGRSLAKPDRVQWILIFAHPIVRYCSPTHLMESLPYLLK